MKDITKEWLEEQYTVLGKSQNQIAKECGRSQAGIGKMLRRLGIQTRHPTTFKDIRGQEFNNWTVKRFVGRRKANHSALWECECKCGNIAVLDLYAIQNGGTEFCGKCYTKKTIPISQYKCFSIYWTRIKYGAKSRNLTFNITPEFAWKILEEQDFRCALTGDPINFANTRKGYKTGESTASLDRIDSNVGYEPNNIQWIHKDLQKMKTNYKEDRFFELCKKVTEGPKQDVSISDGI